MKGFYIPNVFETSFMVDNDDLKGKTTYFTGFYTPTTSRTKNKKTPIVLRERDAIETAILNACKSVNYT